MTSTPTTQVPSPGMVKARRSRGFGPILIVERRPSSVLPSQDSRYLPQRLRPLGRRADLRVAHSAWEALEILRRSHMRFKLLVIDENAGWMDPLDFVHRAQAIDPSLPAIVACPRLAEALYVAPPSSPQMPAHALPHPAQAAILELLRHDPDQALAHQWELLSSAAAEPTSHRAAHANA